MIKKIFITGATGYIGKFLVEFLSKKGFIIFVNIRKNKQSPFSKKINTYTIGKQNIDKDIIFFKKNNFDAVIHLATLYIKYHNVNQIGDMVRSNIFFATHVLECAVQAKVPFFINTGTFFQNKNKMNFSPVNLYSSTKEAFEIISKFYYESKKIQFFTIKLSDTYGPNDSRPKLINLLLDSLKTGEQINLNANKNQIINLLHIDDVINSFHMLMLDVAQNENINGRTFSLFPKNPISIEKLINLFEELSSVKLNIIWNESNDILVAEPPEKYLIKNWEPKISLKTGIRSILEK